MTARELLVMAGWAVVGTAFSVACYLLGLVVLWALLGGAS